MSFVNVLALSIILLTGTFAQQPTRPTISETFVAEYEVERHDRDGLEFGRGNMARNKDENKGVFNTTYERGDIDYELLLYNDASIYSIKGRRNEGHCSKESLDATTLPPYWSWLTRASYGGQREIRHIMYEIWMSEEGGIRQEVGIEANTTTPNIPKFYGRRTPEIEITLDFTTFQAITPPARDFDIPAECRERITASKLTSSHASAFKEVSVRDKMRRLRARKLRHKINY